MKIICPKELRILTKGTVDAFKEGSGFGWTISKVPVRCLQHNPGLPIVLPQISFTTEHLQKEISWASPHRSGQPADRVIPRAGPGVPSFRPHRSGQPGHGIGSVLFCWWHPNSERSRTLVGSWKLFGEDFNKGSGENCLDSLNLSVRHDVRGGKSILSFICCFVLLPAGPCLLPCHTPRACPGPLWVLHTLCPLSPAQPSH